jgi:hypothetical protein
VVPPENCVLDYLLYSVGEFIGAIKSNSFDPRALGHLRTFMMTPPMPHK